jgi:hypothetical protein
MMICVVEDIVTVNVNVMMMDVMMMNVVVLMMMRCGFL